MYQVYFIREKRGVEVPEDTMLLEAERLAGLVPDAPCGGTGTCLKFHCANICSNNIMK